MPRSNLLIVRQWSQVGLVKAPKVPAGWEVIPEADGVASIYTNGRPGIFVHSVCLLVSGPNALFALFGPRLAIDRIGAISTNTWESIAALRADNGAVATQIKSAWIDTRTQAQVSAGVPVVSVCKRVSGFQADDAESAVP